MRVDGLSLPDIPRPRGCSQHFGAGRCCALGGELKNIRDRCLVVMDPDNPRTWLPRGLGEERAGLQRQRQAASEAKSAQAEKAVREKAQQSRRARRNEKREVSQLWRNERNN